MVLRQTRRTTSTLCQVGRASSCRHHLALSTRYLHTSRVSAATPLPYPTVPGPTPKPPQPPTEESTDRLTRRKNQLEALQASRAATATSAAPKSTPSGSNLLKKRFWKDVSVVERDDGLQILLDARPVRTASKEILTLPTLKHALATAIALEWDLLVSAQQALKGHYIPLTSLAARAVDIKTADDRQDPTIRNDLVKVLMRYLETDTLLCWAPISAGTDRGLMNADAESDHNAGQKKPSLRDTQIATAEPVIAFLKSHIFPGLDIGPSLDHDSILPKPQSPLTEQVVRGWIHGLPAFELAALERGVLATKSLLIAIRLLVEWSQHFSDLPQKTAGQSVKRFGIQEAADACSVEVRWQTDMWGEVEDTHDVEKEDLARQLGSAILLVS